jgi:hypothetical protein
MTATTAVTAMNVTKMAKRLRARCTSAKFTRQS